MKNDVVIGNSLHHILAYGYFQHAFELYLEHIKPKDVSALEVAEMKQVFSNIRTKLKGKTFLTPNILNTIQNGNRSLYPFYPYFNSQEKYWFKEIITIPFKTASNKTKKYFKNQKEELPVNFYSELFKNLRTVKAIEYLRQEFLKP